MIHYQRIGEIQDRLHEITYEVDLAKDREKAAFREEQGCLFQELQALQSEQEVYRDGYDAGVEFHLGSGHDAWDDASRSQKWLDGFWAAGEDS